MADGFEELLNFTEALAKGVNKTIALDNSTIIHEGQIVDSSLPIDDQRLSPDDDEAMKEHNYLQKRKGGTFTEKDTDEIGKLLRDMVNENFKDCK